MGSGVGPIDYLFDSNVLIYVLNRYNDAALEFLSSTPINSRAISMITWMEVLAGATAPDVDETRRFLNDFQLVELTKEIAETTVSIRRSMRLKLPDAIIYATAITTGRTLVTFNSRDFSPGTPLTRLLGIRPS